MDGRGVKHRKGGKKHSKLGAKKTRYESKFFDAVAGRPMRNIVSPEQMITVQLTYYTGNVLTTSGSIPQNVGQFFVLSQFARYSQYLTVFDQYCFDEIEVWIEPNISQGVPVTAAILATAIDLDDANAPSTLDEVAAKQQSLVGEGLQGRYHRWVPHVSLAAFSGAFTSYTSSEAMWLDSASPSVQHYGLKLASTASGNPITYSLSARATVSFRSPGL